MSSIGFDNYLVNQAVKEKPKRLKVSKSGISKYFKLHKFFRKITEDSQEAYERRQGLQKHKAWAGACFES